MSDKSLSLSILFEHPTIREAPLAELTEVVERLEAFAGWCRQIDDTPGIAIGLTDRDRLLHVSTAGVANLDASTPVTPVTLFEIGSIGKSFTAIILLQLYETGEVDLHAAVTRYLPWFAVRSDYAPITLHHLLSHSAGIIAGTDATPDALSEVWALRETETGAPPGERFGYSNVGYKTLGLVLEAVTGRSYQDLVQERILDRLGMGDTAPALTHAVRPRLAVGYRQAADDVPRRTGLPLTAAPWVETNTADGSIASTVGDLAMYLRMLMNGGRGLNGPLLTAASYERLTTPAIEVWPGGSYCYGLFRSDLEGHVSLGHGGGMPGFYSAMRSDLDSGFGAVVFVNGPGRPDDVARYALALLRASAEDAPLPDPPREERPDKAALAAYVGSYRNGDRTLCVVERGEGIGLALADGFAPLEPLHDDTFAVDHPDWERFTLGVGRDGERIVEAWHGGEWWVGDGYAGPTEFEVPAAWHAYPGHYRSHNPWATNFRIVIRKGELWLLVPGSDSDGIGEQEHLVPIGDPAAGLFRIGDDERSPERLQFSAIVEGRALLARLSGADYARFFTP